MTWFFQVLKRDKKSFLHSDVIFLVTIKFSLHNLKTIITFLISGIFFFTSCNQQDKNTSKPDKLILHFEIDSNGNITDEKVKKKVLALGKELERSADKMMMSSYTEQSGNIEQNKKLQRQWQGQSES